MSFPVLHSPITSAGIKYSLHHLQPFHVKLEGKGKDGLDLTVRVSFHSHVYSKADSDEATGHRFKDEGGKWREFCTDRYGWCVDLPVICTAMVEQNFPSWESQDAGQKNNMAVSEAVPTSGLKYLIFYDLHPSQSSGIDVELVVKSAYKKQFFADRVGKRLKVHALLRTVLYKGVRMPK
ncbi:hypothetical protein SAMN05216456_1302 [Devosia crocina]|uniref:Uncharacterized protein n=1 Tax=Devosia crocina TaxID=429728 RepID=A0A1I7N9H9_9HYPH|nr:hypothetical protein [Devosia crocina]SFV31317.1 hypothetical protein SAMN05216456_1302 [Devosia crocina]